MGTGRSAEELAAAIAERHGSGTREALAAARELSDELASTADQVLGHVVAAARDAGMTWTEIGDLLGVSKQAVQQRFTVRFAQEPIVIGSGLFSRFDGALSEALLTAGSAARAEGASHVTTEHLLVGLANVRRGRAAGIILSLAPDLAESLATSRTRPPGIRRRSGTLPFGADARAAFSTIESIAQQRELETIGTEHLLLALAGEVLSGTGARLHEHGVTPHRIEQILG